MTGALPPPPDRLGPDAFLFLDFDGTLVPLAETPDGVVVDGGLPDLLCRLASARPGRVALLSGRSLAQLDAMLGEGARALDAAGSHGAELRRAGASLETASVAPALHAVAAEAEAFAADRPGVLIEVKTLGVGIHYRRAPAHASAAAALAQWLAGAHGLVVQEGKMMAEVRVAGSKGAALDALLAGAPGARPFALGDDVTDEDAFRAAARAGGAGVLVGPERDTAASYRLPDPAAVRRWLDAQAG